MKIYTPFDVSSMQKRIEKTKVDKYSVHLEDYENINDLIERSIRTKTPFKEEKISGLEYDDEKVIDDFLAGPRDNDTGEVSDQDEQSEVKSDTQPVEEVSANAS